MVSVVVFSVVFIAVVELTIVDGVVSSFGFGGSIVIGISPEPSVIS